MRWLLVTIFICAQAVGAAAQEDKGVIVNYLQDALSGLGRDVQIEGFSGALSARAQMDRLTIADDEGIWLTLDGAVLDWNRTAVLRGRVEINEISAERIELLRLPTASGSPSAEAGVFSLPDLPVSLRIDAITAPEVILGASVLGEPVVASISGAAMLASGEGSAALAITRKQGPRGTFDLSAAFSNETRVLAVDLSLDEAAGGLAATLLGLPDTPAVQLTIAGDAPLDDFTADIRLASDGAERLVGAITTQTAPEATPDGLTRVIEADLSGDLTELFAPQYRAFFGPEVSLSSRVRLFDDGRVLLDGVRLNAAALNIEGHMALGADRLPEVFDLNVVLGDPTGQPVLLPLAGAETTVGRATLMAEFDRTQGERWTLTGDLQALERDDLTLGAAQFEAGGAIRSDDLRQVTGRVDVIAQTVVLADPALADALGDTLSFGVNIDWQDDDPLQLTNLALSTKGMVLTGKGQVSGLASDGLIQGQLQANVADMARFAKLAGRPLGGSLGAQIRGDLALLTGAFDLNLTANGTDLAIGIAQADQILTGATQLEIAATRDTTGLTLKAAQIRTQNGSVSASGQVATDDSDLRFSAAIPEVGQFVQGLDGRASLSGRAVQDRQGWQLSITGQGPRASRVSADALVPNDAPISAEFAARMGDIGWLVPDLPGAAQISGTIRQQGSGWAIDTEATGPGGTQGRVQGQIASDASTAALALTGVAPLGVINRQLSPNRIEGVAQFDLSLNGPLALSSITGQARTIGARLSLPALGNALTGIDATMTLAGSAADIQAAARWTAGGGVSASGRIGLVTPMAADIAVQLQNITVSDPDLYQTSANGALRIAGTLSAGLEVSGQIALGQTELRVPSTGIDMIADIPSITHIAEPSDVRRTRELAGLLASADVGQDTTRAIGLDVQILAENRIFVRGRGLDAELGGQLRVTGTTTNIIPQGRFELIRGRLDILGKRLLLDEGSAQLQGGMVPILRLVARTTADDTTILVTVEGPADSPEITFSSEPDLPQDEVLALLLFGNGVARLSAFQAVQLASAVATLAGRGGDGIIERLRESTGFDDLDVTSDGTGGTSLTVGKYINENAYTNVEIDSTGQSRINLNLDLTPSTTLRGQVGSDGETGIGVYYERDY